MIGGDDQLLGGDNHVLGGDDQLLSGDNQLLGDNAQLRLQSRRDDAQLLVGDDQSLGDDDQLPLINKDKTVTQNKLSVWYPVLSSIFCFIPFGLISTIFYTKANKAIVITWF